MKHQEVDRVVKLDARNVLKLPAIDGRRTDWRDSIETGLTLRVAPNGHRSFAFVYRFAGRVRRFTIGSARDVMLADARRVAAKKKGDVAHGTDPQAAKKDEAAAAKAEATRKKADANRLTVAGLAELWLTSRAARDWRPSTRTGFERFVRAEILPALGARAVEEVQSRDVARFLDAIEERSASSAARCFEVTRAMFRWAAAPQKGGAPLAPRNPCEGLRYAHKTERERVYTTDELRGIFAAIKGTEVEDLVPFVAYTAARSHEARAARWQDVDVERRVWTIPADDAKSGRAHPVPLSDGALRVLAAIREKTGDGEFLFPAPAKCRTCGRSGHMDPPIKTMTGLAQRARLHDLRRTVADRLRNDLDVAPHVVDLGVLGHEVPRLWRTYMPGANLAEVRRALDRWSAHLDFMLAGEAEPAASRVVPFGRA